MVDLHAQLENIGSIKRDRLTEFYPRVRDRDDISVLRDSSTGVIVLSRSDHINQSYYANRTEENFYNIQDSNPITPRSEDNIRRDTQFSKYIFNKHWMDFGCGFGFMLDEMASKARSSVGLEPCLQRATIAKSRGHMIVNELDQLADNSIEVVTMFHVFEHLEDPLGTLKSLQRILCSEGILIIEVPHARDALITLYDCEAFKRFTFWSEHLVLHTQDSLSNILKAAKFQKLEIKGYQRYSLANHMFWLAKGEPGGDDKYAFLNALNEDYANKLINIDKTDTLIAIFKLKN